MLKVIHLFNFSKGSRYHAMISQGLLASGDIDARFALPVISLGTTIREAEKNVHAALAEADYIFRCDDEHFGFVEVDRFLDDNNLWKKVVYYDKKDSPALDEHRLNSCAAYIKRSWPIGYDRSPRPVPPHPVLPLDFSLLSEYQTVPVPDTKDIDTACLFPRTNTIGRRRYSLLCELDKAKSSMGTTVIGLYTAGAKHGRRAIFDPPKNNPFLEYLRMLKRARIVFTAYPDNWDGDSRTWEAFSSGALVFMDTTAIPSPYPLLNGKHCFTFDAREKSSIQTAIETARYYLAHENERKEIALAGYKYACAHHQPLNRIRQIIRWVQSGDKKLEDHVVL